METRQGSQPKAVEAQIEWLNWDQAMRVVRLARVGAMPWAVLTDWCAHGHIDTVAALCIYNGELTRDAALEPVVWSFTSSRGTSLVDPLDGSITVSWSATETNERYSAQIIGPRFRKDQLLSLLTHIDAHQIQEALDAEGKWLSGSRPGTTTPVGPASEREKGRRGRKPELERWQAFYFAVIELAQDGRLGPEHFRSADALRDELLELMGKGAFDPDHIKGTVAQIYKRFIER